MLLLRVHTWLPFSMEIRLQGHQLSRVDPSSSFPVFPHWTATTSIYLTGKLRFWAFVVQE